MKVSFDDFKEKLTSFLEKFAKAPNEEINRFAAAVVLVRKAKEIESCLASVVDQDGKVDLDDVKKMIDAGFAASGGRLPILIKHRVLQFFGAEPEKVTILKTDSDRFFAEFSG